MADLYFGRMDSYTRDEEENSITVRTQGEWDVGRDAWILDIREWCAKNNIKMKWLGESTNMKDGHSWYEFNCYIKDERQKILFLLRWS